MNAKSAKLGFTLIEILVAMAIIVMIVSMVYGSYIATSRSTETYRLNLDTTQKAITILEQISQQIRCCYAKKFVQPYKGKAKPDTTINFFQGNPDKPNGEILHLVTTKSIPPDQNLIGGLFDVTYMFDRSTDTLLISEKIFAGSSKNSTTNNWQPLITNIIDIELAFYDGKKWLKNWDFKRQKKLPSAVKISITLVDKNGQQYRYDTIATVYCQNQQVAPNKSLPPKQ